MAALPALKRSATSGARMARLDRPVTRVYANRPMWQVPERKHWLNEMANQNTYLTHAVGIVGCMVAAQFVVVNFGGSGYGAPPPPRLCFQGPPDFFAVGRRCHHSVLRSSRSRALSCSSLAGIVAARSTCSVGSRSARSGGWKKCSIASGLI